MGADLASRYAEAMKGHPYGHGLYVPESSHALMPSACGYLDKHGRWEPIAYLDTPESLSEAGLSAPDMLVPRKPRTLYWGPKKSSNVSVSRLGFEAGASMIPAGFPASVDLVLDFESTSDYGAVLHCPEKIFFEGYYRRSLLEWAKKNAKAILDVAPDVGEEGEFWVVTDTYATTNVWVNAWTGRGKHVKMGFNLNLSSIGAGEIGPSCEFFRENRASADWDHSEAEGDEKLVVFFSGLRMKYRWLKLGITSAHEIRGDEPLIVHGKEGKDYQFEAEYIGLEHGDTAL